jgi:predicted metal-dependent HD superfamily phosphohydrolase
VGKSKSIRFFESVDTAALKTRWNTLIRRCGTNSKQADAYFTALAQAYGEPNRTYHNLSHIAHVLYELEAAGVDNPAAEWAAWYHDAIYRPGAANNEAKSAALAQRVLIELGAPAPTRDQVARLILATRAHGPYPPSAAARSRPDPDRALRGQSAAPAPAPDAPHQL